MSIPTTGLLSKSFLSDQSHTIVTDVSLHSIDSDTGDHATHIVLARAAKTAKWWLIYR